ncbi:MAG: hypothetical protein QY325_05860 [Flavobacteriales bacterium]|mgnify:CR=1 FL=1|jgi:hypothetical protein|nr:MAG: hypothetical protein QY325_05860 [Flavobacteriales bacterium]
MTLRFRTAPFELTLAALLAGPSIAAGQGFVNTFGGPKAEDGVGIVQEGAGFAIATRRHTASEPAFTGELLRIAANGSALSWEPIAGLDGIVFLQGMAPATGGGAFLAGSRFAPDSSQHDGLVVKLLADGGTDWIAHPTAPGDQQYLCVSGLPDGGAIAAGVRSIGSGHDAWVCRFDSDGALLWSQAVGDLSDEEALALEVQGSDVLITGRQANFGGTSDAFLARLGLDGTIAWTTSWGGIGQEVGRGLKAIGPGSFLLAGTTSSDGAYDFTEQRRKDHVYLVAFDLNGDSLWTRAIGDTLFDRRAWCLDIAGNGDILVGGERSPISATSDALAYRLDAQGQVIWQRTWDLGKEERLQAIHALPDGFIATGWAFTDAARQVLAIRRDPNGN